MIPHHINSRPFSAFSSLPQELAFEPHKNYLFDISYLDRLKVTGEQAQTFLQGQVSCDVRKVTPQQFRQGALCNLQGRVLALVDILNVTKDQYQLILPSDLVLKTKASLEKAAMLSRVSLEVIEHYSFFGFFLQNPKDIMPLDSLPSDIRYSVTQKDDVHWYCLNHPFYVMLVPKSFAPTLREPFHQLQQWRGSLSWHALQLQQKRIEIYPTSRGLFLPHRLGLHLSEYLSFDKGCYKGQEIIARTHYRAKLKHELQLFTIQTEENLQSGQRLFRDKNGEEIGELIDFCPLGNHQFLIAASVLFDHPTIVHIEHHQDLTTLSPMRDL